VGNSLTGKGTNSGYGFNYLQPYSISSGNANELINNTITNYQYGVVMSQNGFYLATGLLQTTNTNPLRAKLCSNYIYGNDVGIIGCGVSEQGSATNNIAAGNEFSNSVGNNGNSSADISWPYGLDYRYSNAGFQTPSFTNTNFCFSNLGLGSSTIVLLTGSYTQCTSANMFRKHGHSQFLTASIELFPNPGSGSFNLACSQGIGQVTIQSLAGQTLVERQGLGSTILEVNARQLASGLYIIVLKDVNGNRHSLRWSNIVP
jgi:hypothetical protein